MKKLLMFLTFVMMVMVGLAQSQPKFSYQAVLRDTNDRLVTNGNNITLKWEVMNLSNNVIYTETYTGLTTNSQGLFSLYLGDSTVGIGSFGAVEWYNARVRTTLIYNGQTIVSPIQPVMAVPYALIADDLNPNGKTIKEIYHTIDTVKAHIRQELADTSVSIRYQIDTVKTQLRVEIDTTSQQIRSALVDTATNLRGYINTRAAQLQQNLDDSTSAVRSALIDTAADIRGALVDNFNRVGVAIHDSVSILRDSIKSLKDSIHALRVSIEQMKLHMKQGGDNVEFTAMDNQTAFILASGLDEPQSGTLIMMYINGVRVRSAAVSYDSGTRTFTYDPTEFGNKMIIADDIVEFEWNNF